MGRAHAGTAGGAALVVAALALGLGLAHAHHSQREHITRYDRYEQPGFDARVYAAMADDPAFFTVEPWGYRLLSPWIAHLLSDAPGADTFMALTLAALVTSGLLLFFWLRRLGHAPFVSALGVTAFAFSPPVAWAVRDPFLAEPLLCVLLMLFLLALERRAGLATLALLAALGALGKDVFLFFLPAVFFVRRTEVGTRRALLDAGVVAAPALAVTVLLRAWWTPYLPDGAGGLPSSDVFWLALWRILEGAPLWGGSALLLGVTPLALAGALSAHSRPFLRRHGWLLAVTWGLPFAASVYTDDTASVPFFADDIPRLLLYALPLTLHLALCVLGPARRGAPLDQPRQPDTTASASSVRARRAAAVTAALATAVVTAFPLLALDRYRRVDLRGPRDGPLLLALSRQSLAFARRLEAGRTVAYDVRARRYRPGRDLPRYLERMRWFLRDGWGERPHYADGPAWMRARSAALLIPCLRPDDWNLTLTLNAARPAALAVALNGRELQRVAFEGETRLRLRVPAGALFRGDNRLSLTADADDPRIELIDVRIIPQRPPQRPK